MNYFYLDNAATSWPKPPEVIAAMQEYLAHTGGNPGRSGHALSIAAARSIYTTRELVAELFHFSDPLRIIFTANATTAINIALFGLLKSGDQVITTAIEHNAVMRPLRELEQRGIRITIIPCSNEGLIDLSYLHRQITNKTKLVIINHGSNVIGTVQSLAEISQIVHQTTALFMVDAAQTAGVFPIDMQKLDIDLLAFTGHKGLYGPTGTGGLLISSRIDTKSFNPLYYGGTGSLSESEQQPEYLPDKFESGTLNGVGLAGLAAGIRFVLNQGIEYIHYHELNLIQMLLDGLSALPNVKIYGPNRTTNRIGVISFTIDNQSVSDIGLKLEEDYGILARVGLHCAPAAHKTIGSFPKGTVRFAPGIYTTKEDIAAVIEAVRTIAQ
ncbi:MAG: aminotransferase class V-fold PLP-dependent enzyme [bacterium]